MITIGGRRELSPDIVSSMHEFRNEIFVRRLGWSLPMLEGIERDEYDNDNTVYFVVQDALGKVTACTRLLPTVTPCMLHNLFGELLGGNSPPRDPSIWELSRFATNVRKSGDGRALALSEPTLQLLRAVLRFAKQQHVERLVLVTSVAIERLLIRSGFQMHRVAAPCRMPDGLLVALFIEVEPEEGAEPANSPTPAAREAAHV
jgi:N-acyl-L-homoserine lactone synthetase